MDRNHPNLIRNRDGLRWGYRVSRKRFERGMVSLFGPDRRDSGPLNVAPWRRMLRPSCVFILAVFLSAPPVVFATLPVLAQNPNWDGTVEVSPSTLNLKKGESTSYRIRLSKQPTGDGWWVRIFVDGAVRADGDYNGIRWVPSVGWEFDRNSQDPNDPTPWRSITIYSLEDSKDQDQSIEITHEVWDHETNCPVHEVGDVTVSVSDGGNGGNGGNGGGNGGNGGGNNGNGGNDGMVGMEEKRRERREWWEWWEWWERRKRR